MDKFDERRAIEQSIQDLKEQTRMDYDLYMESRKVRNEQVNILLDRLRQLDERDRQEAQVNFEKTFEKTNSLLDRLRESGLGIINDRVRVDKEIRTAPNEVEFEAPVISSENNAKSVIAELNERERLSNVKLNIEKELVTNKKTIRSGKVGQIALERVEPLVIKYLMEQGGEGKLVEVKGIKKYVEGSLEHSWRNFSEVLRGVMRRNNKIKSGDKRGTYYLETGKES